MDRFDVLFNYNNITRFILLHKLSSVNSFSIPNVYKLVCFFSIKNLDDMTDVKIYNYFYFFKFFFGSRAFFTGYKIDQGFGKTAYNFNIQLILRKNDLYIPFSFFIYDILPIIDHDYLVINFKKLNYFICSISIKDMNIFSEKKTNLGLFNLKDNFNLKFFFVGLDFISVKLYFNNMKLNFIK